MRVSNHLHVHITLPYLCLAVDEVSPVIVFCTDDVTSEIPLNQGGTTVTYIEPSATDNSGTVTVSSQSHAPGDFFVTGATSVTYVFVDPSGNTASCTFAVNVVEGNVGVKISQLCGSWS